MANPKKKTFTPLTPIAPRMNALRLLVVCLPFGLKAYVNAKKCETTCGKSGQWSTKNHWAPALNRKGLQDCITLYLMTHLPACSAQFPPRPTHLTDPRLELFWPPMQLAQYWH